MFNRNINVHSISLQETWKTTDKTQDVVREIKQKSEEI
jgi:ribosomal protein S2